MAIKAFEHASIVENQDLKVKNENSVMIYSPASRSPILGPQISFGTQIKIVLKWSGSFLSSP